ncbi:MAG TPA: SCO family protein [Saprospiraceae bacterium]|nr:SCO family protein [Saprospiraceae bacterium]
MRLPAAYLIVLTLLSLSCSKKKLPILGLRQIENGDTIYAKTPDFSFLNQYGNRMDKSILEGQIHVANFFFTSCPTICPKTIRSMIRIAEHFKDHPKISYLNFSIDYKKDSVERLKSYYDKLQVSIKQFHLLHIPSMEEIKRVTEMYMSIAVEDPDAPGGFDHSGWLLLADKDFHIRSYCLGTDDKEVDRFIEDIESLLDEME